MTQLIGRNKVRDFETWKAIFDSHVEAQRESGLVLRRLWRRIEDPNDVFFIFDVRDIEEATAFMNAPEAEEAGRDSGVVEADYYFVEAADLL